MIRLLDRGTDPATARRTRTRTEQPFYARMLRLRHIHPGGLLCFLFLEATTTLAVLLALAELVPWIAIPVLPLTVAALVKVNDVIVGASPRNQPRRPFTVRPVYIMGGGYAPMSPVRVLDAATARPGLYGTPLALPSGRSTRSGLYGTPLPELPPGPSRTSGVYGTRLGVAPARGVATVEKPAARASSTIYGSASSASADVP
ncbi:MAG TPA: hypothetical protein VKB69_08060, partial [Micromonosporaceae bacterium]|nr:hypothetical protein [Micromonosporaceae bacterium]